MPTVHETDKALHPTRPATIVDVARHVGLSKTTVSAALTGNGRLMQETRDMVLQAAKELNYRAHPHAQSLRKRNSNEIILMSGGMDLGVGTRKMTLIQERLSASGFNSPIYAYSQESQASAIDQSSLLAAVARVQPRAVVCNVMKLEEESRQILQDLQDKGTIVVFYDYEVENAEGFNQVIFDRFNNTYQAAHYLLELGHRDLGLVVFRNSPTSAIRQRGFEQALAEFGLKPRLEWIFNGRITISGYSEYVGIETAQQFLNLDERPTGICIVNDLTALAFIGEIGRAGFRVPEQISVVGHDDIPICQYASLRLSSVSHPVEKIADTVAEIILDRLKDESLKPTQCWVRGETHGRESSAAPPPA